MAKKDKKNIFNSLNNLFTNLNDKTHNIILSIGSDSNLDRNIERLYTNMIENFNNQEDTALIFISETKTIDFPREIMQQFKKEEGNYFIADFICPTPKARSLLAADYTVWVDTIQKGRFEDTNQMFVKPEKFDFHVTSQDAKNWAPKILEDLKK